MANVDLETLAALNKIMKSANLHVDMQEFLMLLKALGALPKKAQEQITWASVGMSVAAMASQEGAFTNERE